MKNNMTDNPWLEPVKIYFDKSIETMAQQYIGVSIAEGIDDIGVSDEIKFYTKAQLHETSNSLNGLNTYTIDVTKIYGDSDRIQKLFNDRVVASCQNIASKYDNIIIFEQDQLGNLLFTRADIT